MFILNDIQISTPKSLSVLNSIDFPSSVDELPLNEIKLLAPWEVSSCGTICFSHSS